MHATLCGIPKLERSREGHLDFFDRKVAKHGITSLPNNFVSATTIFSFLSTNPPTDGGSISVKVLFIPLGGNIGVTCNGRSIFGAQNLKNFRIVSKTFNYDITKFNVSGQEIGDKRRFLTSEVKLN